MIKLTLPTTPDEIRKLKAGDEVSITGVMVTARDAAHKYLVETEAEDVRDLLKGSMIYHCGPVVRKGDDGKYTFVAAGPTTSIREEPYEAAVIDKYEVRGVIGKGGMGGDTLAACGEHGSVYLSAIGGIYVPFPIPGIGNFSSSPFPAGFAPRMTLLNSEPYVAIFSASSRSAKMPRASFLTSGAPSCSLIVFLAAASIRIYSTPFLQTAWQDEQPTHRLSASMTYLSISSSPSAAFLIRAVFPRA